MTDPRYILEITDQYRQYGPWGIRVPSGGTIYFNTKEEAEKYMEEHPWTAVPAQSEVKDSLPNDAYGKESLTIPPTSAPFSQGGFASDDQPQQDAPINDHAQNLRYAEQLAEGIAKRCYPDVPQFRPLSGDLFGLLTQIDNMTTGMERTGRAEAALTQAREALADMLHVAEMDGWDKASTGRQFIYRAALAATQPKP